MMKIEVYTKHNCPNCVMAKQLLNANNLAYTELDVREPDVMLQLITRYPDVRQMPQIFIDDQRVGGLAGLQAALEQI